ncbi:hypothetical protein SAMN00017405_1252 [Desulfonispora thiosulfatigenes DSM 11270]|uniref:Uncharacterized protein n=1 Tax=Desulfonispora thiosulfatigenes DSM 11270 TaxID=656914 RepID=A0A1W1V1K6_DESTI|nr:hypothetical protein [Desulfonispora thiosulfatigenes]SMB87202.1 hypothetical protein SAMN00017405_1252 [Desulfonispora thiosulfatigenes DSM 11270]
MAKKSCSACKNSARVTGNSFIYLQNRLQEHHECMLNKELDKIGKDHGWDNLKMPEVCGKYDPKMVARCSYCGKDINKPEHEWDLFAGPEISPVCCVDCQTKKEAADIANWFSD